MTASRWLTRKDALEAGWFSRRHETSEAHREAVAKWRATRGREARRLRAEDRKAKEKSDV